MSIRKGKAYIANIITSSARLRDQYFTSTKGSFEDGRLLRTRYGEFSNESCFDVLCFSLNERIKKSHIEPQEPLNSSFCDELHELYIWVIRNPWRVFRLLENDTIVLLAQIELKHLPQKSVPDHIAIFECLLVESANKFGDSDEKSDSENSLMIAKLFGVFLINYSKFNKLPFALIETLGSFVYKLVQYYFSLVSLIDHWFEVSIHEPDVVYLLYRNRLPHNCFPIFELARNFLFLNDRLFDLSKNTLLHLVLTSGFCRTLQDWLLTSDFPSLVSIGLLSTFNDICYNELLLRSHQHDFEKLISTNKNCRGYKNYLRFVTDIFTYASHDSVKSAFLNSFETRFIKPIMELYYGNDSYHTNIVFLLALTFSHFISIPGGEGVNSSQFLIDEFVEKYFEVNQDNKPYVLDLFKRSLLKTSHDNKVAVKSCFRLLDSFAKSKSLTLLSNIFSDDQTFYSSPSDPIIISSLNMLPLTKKTSRIIRFKPYYNEKLINRLHLYYMDIQRSFIVDKDNENTARTWIQFNPLKTFPLILMKHYVQFFDNEQYINACLLRLTKNLVSAHGGRIFNFILSDTGEVEATMFGEIFSYLWDAYSLYSEGLRRGTKVFEIITPDEALVTLFEDADESIKSSLDSWIKQKSKLLNYDNLLSNIRLFEELTIDLHALNCTRNTFNEVLLL